MKLIPKFSKIDDYMYKYTFTEEPDMFTSPKGQWRYRIYNEVFDLYDSVADNAKMISLLFSVVLRIWQIIPDEYKSSLEQEDINMIEYAMNKFKSIQTRADIQYQQEGQALIDKLMNRQAQIAQIISGS